MRTTNCYMPGWRFEHEGADSPVKLLKHGSYCCWEAVVAHATEMKGNGMSHETWKRVIDYIDDLVGCPVLEAPHWSLLRWLNRWETENQIYNSANEFMDAIMYNERLPPVVAVVLNSAGETYEVHCNVDDIKGRFATKLQTPKIMQNAPEHTPQCFTTSRKKALKDRDLVVFYWPFKNGLPYNSSASEKLKMQIYGDVLFVQQSKEPCFLPRERFINFTCAHYTDHFNNKYKRKEHNPLTLSATDYELAKAQMTSELQSSEQLASANAVLPGEIAKASVLPPPTGKELALIAEGRAAARAAASADPPPP